MPKYNIVTLHVVLWHAGSDGSKAGEEQQQSFQNRLVDSASCGSPLCNTPAGSLFLKQWATV